MHKLYKLFKASFSNLLLEEYWAFFFKNRHTSIACYDNGFWTGVRIVARIKDENYRKIVIVLTLVGAFVIFLNKNLPAAKYYSTI